MCKRNTTVVVFVFAILASILIAVASYITVWHTTNLVFSYCSYRVALILGLDISGDYFPPTVQFTIEVGGVRNNSLTALKGRPFTPDIIVNDNADPSPSKQAWITRFFTSIDPGEEGSTWTPLVLGEEMILDELASYFVLVRSEDASGNEHNSIHILDLVDTLKDTKHNTSMESSEISDPYTKQLKTIKAIRESKRGTVEVVIERFVLEEGVHGVGAIDAVVLLGAVFDLSKLNRFYLSMNLLADDGSLIQFQGSIRIGESEAEYLQYENVWRITFNKIFDYPLNSLPDRLIVNFTIDGEHDRENYYRKSSGITQEPNALALIAERLDKE